MRKLTTEKDKQNYKEAKKFWTDRVEKNKTTVDWVCNFPDYYFNADRRKNQKDLVQEFNMASGKVAIYKLIDYELMKDPDDMIKWCKWMFLGYKGLPAVNDCSFEEFLEKYENYIFD